MLNTLAISLAKLSSKTIKLLKLGRASSLPGRLALKLSPQILKHFSNKISKTQSNKRFFITGTNGKSTSTGLLKAIVAEESNNLICNDFGANLYYGICTSLIENFSYFKGLAEDFIIEVDEASLKNVARDLKTEIIAVTNLYRDQLDRYGEISITRDFIVQGINESFAKNPDLKIVLNLDDQNVAQIKEISSATNFFFYSVRQVHQQLEHNEASINKEPAKQSKEAIKPDLEIEIIEENIGSSNLKIKYQNQTCLIRLKLPGAYNAYNAATAIACALVAGVKLETIKKGIENYSTKFGRSEKKQICENEFQIFLIKNPAGTSEVLRYLKNDTQANFTIVINDDYADGRDVSWLWDAQFEYIAQVYKDSPSRRIICSGKRALDMAVRLKYAGIAESQIVVEPNLDKAIKANKKIGSNYLLPTYTALLEIEKTY